MTVLNQIANSRLPSRRRYAVSQRALAWCIWFISSLFVVFQFFLQFTSGEIVEGMMKSFSLSAFYAGVVTSSYYYIYVLLQAPAGLLIDRFGPRRLLSLGAVVMTIGSWGTAVSTTLLFILVSRVLMGAGAAFAFVGCLNLIRQWFPDNRFGFMTAIAEMLGMFGSVAGGVLFAGMIPIYGWQRCMWLAAVVGLMMTVALWVIVRDRPADIEPEPAASLNAFIPAVMGLLRRRVVWLNALYSGLMFSVVTVFIAMWGVPFLETVYHFNLMWSTFMIDLAFVGIAIFCPIIGYLDAVTGWRRWIMVGFPVIGALSVVGILFVSSLNVFFLGGLMLLLGASLSSYILTFVIGNQVSCRHTQATSIGIVNMLCVGTAPLLQPLVGYILDWERGSAAGGVHYSLSQYQGALLVVPALMLLAAAVGYFLPGRVAVESEVLAK